MVFHQPPECANFEQNKSLEETNLIITILFLLIPYSVLNFQTLKNQNLNPKNPPQVECIWT